MKRTDRLASSMRDEIRASLTRDVAASSQKIDNLLHGDTRGDKTYGASQTKSDYPLAISPGAGSDLSSSFGKAPNAPDADDKSFFIGVWRGSFEVMGMSCSSEIIFQPNGDYSSLSQSDNGFYAFRAIGTWQFLGQGNMNIHYKDHDPKEWNHKKLDFPENENIHFRVIDSTHMQSNLCEWQRA
jgi:hypothetical protein